jgi:hypothetical protein
MRKSIIAVVILLAASGAYITAQTPRQDKQDKVDPEKIRAHVKFLSSDLLEGRGMGQRGSDIAAEYIATQFALDGLKPAGDQGSYFQEVSMVKITTLPDTTMSLVPKSGEPLQLKNLDDFVIHNETQTEVADIEAPIVFVGMESPRRNINGTTTKASI